MISVYIKKYRNLPINVWKPGAAWTRAIIYFSFCNIFIVTSGTLEQLISQPLFTLEQITDISWVVYCIFCFIYAFFAYWILWSRMTLTFDRKYYLGAEILFGITWGFCTGGLLLSFYHLWSLTVPFSWARYLLSFLTMGLWQYFIQDYFWDVYISPEHDTPKSIFIKTIVSHIPNMLISLGFLTIWGNYAIFVLIYVVALVASTIFQKFPAPWAKGQFHAPMTKPGIGGFLRGAGYLGVIDKKNNNKSELD
ncbi:MAG: hypothetical protein ACXAC5_15520 [Promethearchaeota archaeon]|jgi:hypothetical protein